MDHLDDHGGVDQGLSHLSCGLAAETDKGWTEMFALIGERVFSVRNDFGVKSRDLLSQALHHREQKRVGRLHNLFPRSRNDGGCRWLLRRPQRTCCCREHFRNLRL